MLAKRHRVIRYRRDPLLARLRPMTLCSTCKTAFGIGFKGSTYGAASKGKHIQLTPELVAQHESRYSANQA
jgi:hypothetical protein